MQFNLFPSSPFTFKPITSALLGACLALNACGPLNTKSLPPQKNGQQQAAVESLNKLVNLECDDDAQCLALPYGYKSCGGPNHYLIYSSLKTDEAALKSQADKITEEEKAKANGPDTCEVRLPPAVACVQRTCQKIGDSIYSPAYPNTLTLESYSKTQPQGCKDFTLYWLSNKGSQHLAIKGDSDKLGLIDMTGWKPTFDVEQTFDIEKLNAEVTKRLEISIEDMNAVTFIKAPTCDEILTRGPVKHAWKAVRGTIIINRNDSRPMDGDVEVSVKLLHVEFEDSKGRLIYVPEWNLSHVITARSGFYKPD